MGIVKKAWGTTNSLIVTPLFEMHGLQVEPMMRCSWHTHQHKYNVFLVISGLVYVDAVQGDIGGEAHEHRLEHAGWLGVAPGVLHRFRTGPDPCTMLEMYYIAPLGEDIKRLDQGGPIPVTCKRCGYLATPTRIGECSYFHTSNTCPHRAA